MNILHLKYAVEIANTKSISKAAENLYMGQPNLSRAIKELEDNLGITVFKRTSKGISITPEGEEFLGYARRIISQIDEVEALYKTVKVKKQTFSVSAPRASYVSEAFASLAAEIDCSMPADIFYKEANPMQVITDVVNEDYNLGIVRYQTGFEKYFRSLFSEKKLISETVTEFSYVMCVSKDSPLAAKDDIDPDELADYIEITRADPYVPNLPIVDVKKAELSESVDKRIYVVERASQFMLLERLPNSFMWVSPVPKDLLDKYHLTQKHCSANQKIYKDVLIYRNGYKLSALDNRFITALCQAKREYISE